MTKIDDSMTTMGVLPFQPLSPAATPGFGFPFGVGPLLQGLPLLALFALAKPRLLRLLILLLFL